jgi:hypothetical protein
MKKNRTFRKKRTIRKYRGLYNRQLNGYTNLTYKMKGGGPNIMNMMRNYVTGRLGNLYRRDPPQTGIPASSVAPVSPVAPEDPPQTGIPVYNWSIHDNENDINTWSNIPVVDAEKVDQDQIYSMVPMGRHILKDQTVSLEEQNEARPGFTTLVDRLKASVLTGIDTHWSSAYITVLNSIRSRKKELSAQEFYNDKISGLNISEIIRMVNTGQIGRIYKWKRLQEIISLLNTEVKNISRREFNISQQALNDLEDELLNILEMQLEISIRLVGNDLNSNNPNYFNTVSNLILTYLGIITYFKLTVYPTLDEQAHFNLIERSRPVIDPYIPPLTAPVSHFLSRRLLQQPESSRSSSRRSPEQPASSRSSSRKSSEQPASSRSSSRKSQEPPASRRPLLRKSPFRPTTPRSARMEQIRKTDNNWRAKTAIFGAENYKYKDPIETSK